jgi:hypothetical protein
MAVQSSSLSVDRLAFVTIQQTSLSSMLLPKAMYKRHIAPIGLRPAKAIFQWHLDCTYG